MSSEKQSTHERRMARNAERDRYAREGITPFTGYVRPKPDQEETDQTARLNAARSLPDGLFADEPEVQRLSAALRTKSALIEKRGPVRDWLAARKSRIVATVDEAESAIPQAILEDALAQDESFSKTREALQTLEFSKAVCAYADAAYDAVAQSNPAAQHALYDARDAARTALNECLFALKLLHVNAQAQAVQNPKEGGM